MHAAVDQIARPTRSLPFRPGHPSGRVGALPGSSVRGTKFLSRVISPRPRGKLLQLRLAPHITSTWRGAVDSVRGKDAPVGAILQCDHHNIAVKPGQRASFDQRGFWPVNGQVRGEHRVNVGQSRSGRRTVRAGVSRNQSLTPPRNFAARSVAVCTNVRNCLCQHATCCAGGFCGSRLHVRRGVTRAGVDVRERCIATRLTWVGTFQEATRGFRRRCRSVCLVPSVFRLRPPL
jgi:hypothetical protein